MSAISSFLERYKEFSAHMQKHKISYYKSRFNSVLSGYNTVKSIIHKYEAKEASTFNIFETLNIETAETRTHTPFLSNLLDPFGTHAQGNLFLKSFIDYFIPVEKKEFFMLDDMMDYQIKQEQRVFNGQLDLYLRSLNSHQKFGIVIENKIHAPDQEEQIQRYYDYLCSKNLSEEQMMLFYLTIWGNKPSQNAISQEFLQKLEQKNLLSTISYKNRDDTNKTIYDWLSYTLQYIKAVKVKTLVKQYLDTIQKL
jgi:hypothetical protein